MRRNVVVAYSKQKKTNFRRILFISAIVIAIILFALLLILAGQEEPQKKESAKEKSKVTVEAMQPKVPPLLNMTTCRKIGENNLPQEISTSFFGGEKAYFYTKLMANPVPQTIKHIWLNPEGKTYAAVDLSIVNQPADTWSYISLPPESSGEWSIRVAVGGQVAGQFKFQVE